MQSPPYGGSANLPDVSDPTLEGYENALKKNKVVVVSKSTCGFCKRSLDILGKATQDLAVFPTDIIGAGAEIRRAAEEASQHKTVPIIFINGEFVGGCEEIVKLDKSGELYTRLGVAPPAATSAWSSEDVCRPAPMRTAWLFFPHTVNIYPVRVIALQMVIICVLCIIFREETWAAWLALAMALDFFIRLWGGAFFSPAGALALVLTSPLKEELRNGPPKQFATFVGLCFSLTAGCLLIKGEKVAGAVIAGCLAGPAALEAFFDFCLGCWFFGLMTDFGIIKNNVYQMHIDQKPYVAAAIQFADDFETQLKDIEKISYREAGQPATAADTNLKRFKNDDHVRRAFNPIKYVQISDSMMPLSISGLALAWRFVRDTESDFFGLTTSRAVRNLWLTITYIAVGVFAIILLLLILKLILYTSKVGKEITHPVKTNFVSAFPMTLCIFAILIQTDSSNPSFALDDGIDYFMRDLMWIGAVMLKLQLIWKVAALISDRADSEVITPAILMPIGGCIVAALSMIFIDPMQEEVAWFLFGLPSLLAILLFGGTFLESIKYHWSDERTRASIGMWSTLLHLIMITHLFLYRKEVPSSISRSEVSNVPAITHILYYAGWTLVIVMVWLAAFTGWLFRLKFDFSFWAIGFSADILAAASAMYQMEVQKLASDGSYTDFYRVCRCFTALAIGAATWINVVLFLQTIYWLIKRRWLRPNYKWGPLSFNKLTHEALRCSGAHLLDTANRIVDIADNSDAAELASLATGLAKQLELHLLVLHWHSHMEDYLLFKMVDSFHPMVTKDGYLQHQVLHKIEHQLQDDCKSLVAMKSKEELIPLLTKVRDTLREAVPYSDEHMDWEEENLNGLLRKGFNLEIQKKLLNNIWDAYNSRSMEEVLNTHKKAGSEWDNYDFTQLGREGAYPMPDKDKKALLNFPPSVPNEPMPIEKQHILRVALPFIVHWLPIPMMKTRFVRALIWATPEHAQHIGDMVYRGVPDTTWALLATDIPEIIPRGLPGWIRRV
eukprot:TRINITY_DN1977_c0_g2_i1.p1 TRINITY_DN1977_c0_g2~~TRINITY_DN1977_c0_g2_i1.p1  ORF type:complete len:1009 (+),score=389.62 TRINITY_DN1977_c0_g2_i1:43-3069(+)